MVWTNTAIPILRVLINDWATVPIYSDDQLTQLLLVGAIYTIQDIDFDILYSVDFVGKIISPDPLTDTIFMNFIMMKAACQADLSTFRAKALMDGISAKCGPTSLTVAGNSKAFQTLLTIGPCATYEGMKLDYIYGTGQMCRAVLSPFIGSHFDPDSLGVTQSYYNLPRTVNPYNDQGEYFT